METVSSTNVALRSRTTAAIALGSLVLVLLAAPLLARALFQLRTRVEFPYPTDQLEGTLLHEARLLGAGEPLYRPLVAHEFVSAPYAPLHPALLALADRYAGPHVFWSGRLISAISALLIGLLIIAIARLVSGSWIAGVFGAAVWLSAPPVLIWSSRIKPDLFMYAWTTLGLLLAVWALDSPSRRVEGIRLCASVVAFGFAFATKQTALVAAFATGLALLLADLRAWRAGERDGFMLRLPLRSRTVGFGLGYLVAIAAIWLGLEWLTGGLFGAHVRGLHRSDWWSSELVVQYIRLLAPYLPLAALAVALWALIGLRYVRGDAALVPACYALVAPFTLLGAAETGANHNHLLETLLGLSIAAACALGFAGRLWGRAPGLSGALLLGAALQLALCFRPQPYFGGELALVDPPERFLHFMRNTPGEILADDIGLLLQAGKPIRYDDPSTMGPAAVSGVWDQRGLLDDIANRRFAAIMIPEDVVADPVPYDGIGRWTTEMRAAIRQHYVLQFPDRINVYVPRR